MNLRWRIPVLACVVVGILCAGVFWSSQQPTDVSVTSQSPVSADGLLWRVGNTQRYLLTVDSSMQMKAGDDLSAPSLDVLIDAELEMHTLEADNDSALVGFQLSSVSLFIADESDPAVNAALATPFRVRMRSGGVPESFEFPAPLNAEHRLILENLVRMFQVNLQTGNAWTARESTALGSYAAAYHRSTPTRISKRKYGFASLAAQPMFAGAMITSTENIELDPQRDWIASMSTSETLKTNGQQGTELTILNLSTLTLQSSTRASVHADNWVFDATDPPVAEVTAEAASALSPDEAQRELLSEVATLNDAGGGRIVMIHRMRDLLRANADQPGILLDALQGQDLTDRTRADLYLALELAGTVQAQTALISVALDASVWSSRDAVRAVVALGGVSKPVPETLTALWDLTLNSQTDDQYQLSSTATFALGSLGKTIRLANAPEYSDLKTRLMDGAMVSATTSERANYIHALGNTHDESLAPGIAVLLKDGATSVRLATAQSLGAIGVDTVADQLVRSLVGEKNGSVRGAIGEALVGWSTPSQGAMDTVRSMINTEKDESARLNMARFLGKNLALFPDNEQLLRQLLRFEPSKQIRQNIAELLAANSL